MSAFDKCTADVATAAQTAGSRDLRSIIVAINSSQVGEGAAQAALATPAARKPSPRRHVSLSVYIYTHNILHTHPACSTVSVVARIERIHEAYLPGRAGTGAVDGWTAPRPKLSRELTCTVVGRTWFTSRRSQLVIAHLSSI